MGKYLPDPEPKELRARLRELLPQVLEAIKAGNAGRAYMYATTAAHVANMLMRIMEAK